MKSPPKTQALTLPATSIVREEAEVSDVESVMPKAKRKSTRGHSVSKTPIPAKKWEKISRIEKIFDYIQKFFKLVHPI